MCSSVIEYVGEADRLLRNFARALSPGGMLVLSYSNRRSLWRAYARHKLQERLPHYAAQCNVWTFTETKDRLTKAGFAIIDRPIFFEAAPFNSRPGLRPLSSFELIGLGLVVARREANS